MKSLIKSRVVLDTNVFISGFVFGGRPEKLITMIKDRRFRLAISQFIAFEIHNTLREFSDSENKLHLADKLILEYSLKFRTPPVVNICRDPKDNQVLDLCLFSKAEYLVTGDKDLLVLGKFMDTKIVTVAEFLRLF